jgi:hypothetical protein
MTPSSILLKSETALANTRRRGGDVVGRKTRRADGVASGLNDPTPVLSRWGEAPEERFGFRGA